MTPKTKQLSNPYSTGSGGPAFENQVQAAFAVMMLTQGFSPCLPAWPISKIKLQGKYAGFDTDDLIVFVKNPAGNHEERKLLAQVKHDVGITKSNKIFAQVIQAAWNDFNNSNLFTVERDAIALITGPLSGTDMEVRTMLEWARNAENAGEFITKVNKTNFSSKTKIEKLKVFQSHLKNVNGGADITDEQLWLFLKSYHFLGYDLDIQAGVTHSLLHSLIGQYSPDNAEAIWALVANEMQSANHNAGTITIASISEEIRSAFQRRVVETIPADLATPPIQTTIDWNQICYPSELAIAILLGSWDENSDQDKAVAGQLANDSYANWISKIREIFQQPESPLTLKNGKWNIARRLEIWQTLGPIIFDEQLDRFRQNAVNVLKELDPQFDLPREERYAANIYGKALKHSHTLRKGLAESLALLGSHPKALTSCSVNKPETIAVLTVREIFDCADWLRWASLNNILPFLAEAAPVQFLDAVDAALQTDPCPFSELFAQEGDGITGGNYTTGLLWGLETLAWDEQYLSRVTVILGELAALDPGGNWGNRPANSLTTIFLPWLPQTIASVEKRQVAIYTLQKELPDIAWNLLLNLMPSQHQTSSGSNRPVWRQTIQEDWSKGVTKQEYWEQVLYYADLVVNAAQIDFSKLVELIGCLVSLPQPAFNKLLTHLESEEVTCKPENERFPLWTKLADLVSKHKRFAEAKWALPADIVNKIDKIAEKLAPQNPLILYKRLFNGRNDDLYEENGNWEDQQKKLEERRQNAICKIVKSNGLEAIIEFAKSVKSSWDVGLLLSIVAEDTVDSAILPDLIATGNSKLDQFAGGFIRGRYLHQGWTWVDKVDPSNWAPAQKVRFLTSLLFIEETWKRSEKLLRENEGEYWKQVIVNPYQAKGNLNLAIDKLLEYNRPNVTINCLYYLLRHKKALDHARTIKALLAAASSKELVDSLDVRHAVEIIKALQDDPNTNPDDLFRVEWAYVPLLNEYQQASPKMLEQRLASDPDFFCEVIRVIYRSRHEDKSGKETTEQQKALATNAYRLLDEWRLLPGMQPDGNLSGEDFNQWLVSVKKVCLESGHLDMALSHIGKLLIHCPPDPDGLWVHHVAAEALNARDAEDMRESFRIGLYNSRGVHSVDPNGKPEKELAAKYKKQADEVENRGYQRLAATLRSLADSYEREAERIISKYKHEGN